MILIFGGNGWIGSKIYNEMVKRGVKIVKAQSRADDLESVKIEIDLAEEEVTHVICFVGRTYGPGENTID